jgi:hypothetical protein
MRSRAAAAVRMAWATSSCSNPSVIAGPSEGTVQTASSPVVAAEATASACAGLSRNVGWAVNTTWSSGRSQRARNWPKPSSSRSNSLMADRLSSIAVGASVRPSRAARDFSASHSSSAISASIWVRSPSPSSSVRDNSWLSWKTGL